MAALYTDKISYTDIPLGTYLDIAYLINIVKPASKMPTYTSDKTQL